MVDDTAGCHGFSCHILLYESRFSCDRYVYDYECSAPAGFFLCSHGKDARHCSEDLLFSCLISHYYVFGFFSSMRRQYYVSLEASGLVGCPCVQCRRNRGALLYARLADWSAMGASYLGDM